MYPGKIGWLFLFAVYITIFIAYADCNTIIVPRDYLKIQEAIDASAPGDIIEIHYDVYKESLSVAKQISLKGVSQEGKKPVVDSGGMGSGIKVESDNVKIEDIRFNNSSTSENKTGDIAGIEILSNNAIIDDNEISFNDGYGIYLKNSRDAIITNNIIKENRWGICIEDSIASNIIKNIVLSNYIGILIKDSINNNLTENIIGYNEYGIGYDIGTYFKNTVENNTFDHNGVNEQQYGKIGPPP